MWCAVDFERASTRELGVLLVCHSIYSLTPRLICLIDVEALEKYNNHDRLQFRQNALLPDKILEGYNWC